MSNFGRQHFYALDRNLELLLPEMLVVLFEASIVLVFLHLFPLAPLHALHLGHLNLAHPLAKAKLLGPLKCFIQQLQRMILVPRSHQA